MKKRFKKGDELYLMVKVYDELSGGYDYTVEWKDVVDGGPTYASVGQAQLVSDADFGTSIDWQAKYNEYNEKAEAKIRELEDKNALLARKNRELEERLSNGDGNVERIMNVALAEKIERLQNNG